MTPRTLSVSTLLLFVGLAFGSADTSSDNVTSSSSSNCSTLCDPMTGEGRYMDAAYSQTYSPCVDEATRKGTTVDALRCEEKATSTCLSLCQSNQ